MKILKFLYLSLFFTIHIYADSNILYFGIAKDGTGLVHPYDTIVESHLKSS